jgi:nucleoside-diphosphate-sugar epimerase
MKKILITGGAGFLGVNVTLAFLKKGYSIVAVDNFITSNKNNISRLKSNPGYTFIKHDIIKPFPKSLFTSDIDSIFHLACPTGVPNLIPLAEEMLYTSSFGTKNVLELAHTTKARLVFTSSSEVYGDPKVFPQKEEYTGNVQTTGIRSSYEEGKRFAESLIAMYVRKYAINAKIVRVFNTYGPYMTLHDTRVIPHFLHQIMSNESLTVHGKGLQKRTFCYVDDLVKGLLLVNEKGMKGEVYNLGSDKEITIKKLAETIIKLSGRKSNIVFSDRPIHDHKRRLPSLEKIEKLGWNLSVDLEEGLRRTMQWYGF